MRKFTAVIAMLLLASFAAAKHKNENKDKIVYQVGIFTSNREVTDSALVTGGGCGIGGCSTGNVTQLAA